MSNQDHWINETCKHCRGLYPILLFVRRKMPDGTMKESSNPADTTTCFACASRGHMLAFRGPCYLCREDGAVADRKHYVIPRGEAFV